MFSGTVSALALCHPASSITMRMKSSGCRLLTFRKKMDMVCSFTRGKISESIQPLCGDIATRACVYSRTIWFATLGRIPRDAQHRQGVLILPKRPSSWNMKSSRTPTEPSALAHLPTILGSFFKALPGFAIALSMPRSRDDRSPIMPGVDQEDHVTRPKALP